MDHDVSAMVLESMADQIDGDVDELAAAWEGRDVFDPGEVQLLLRAAAARRQAAEHRARATACRRVAAAPHN